MRDFINMSRNELEIELKSLNERYNAFISMGLKLDMSRGKPCAEQLELSMDMLDFPSSVGSCKTIAGIDARNYGILDGIPEAKSLFAQMLEVDSDEVIVGGNSSLNLMYDSIARAMSFGVYGSPEPWCKLPEIKFLCPSPGYDRHFAITELFGFDMIIVDMKDNGPDMDTVEELVAGDPYIKGIWCTPIYSNPEGITYDDDTVLRLATMKTAAPDFRIFWDCAYIVHHLSDKQDKLKNILKACKNAGNPDRVFIYASTSKMTFPGAGISAIASSTNNISEIKSRLGIQTIGHDKLNQLRHVKYLKDLDSIGKHMEKHAEILRPKFETVLDVLESELGGKNIAWWNKPKGGYFISFNTLPGSARDAVKLAFEAGLIVTPAGATYPYGKDPRDRNIRLAPTLPPIKDLKVAMELLCTCVQIVSAKKLLG